MTPTLLVAASSGYVDWGAMWKILVIGLVAGAGLAAVYSIGLVALSASGYLSKVADGAPARRNVLALVAAAVCLLIVVAGVVYGVHEIFVK
jgi:hypothetical protein